MLGFFAVLKWDARHSSDGAGVADATLLERGVIELHVGSRWHAVVLIAQ